MIGWLSFLWGMVVFFPKNTCEMGWGERWSQRSKNTCFLSVWLSFTYTHYRSALKMVTVTESSESKECSLCENGYSAGWRVNYSFADAKILETWYIPMFQPGCHIVIAVKSTCFCWAATGHHVCTWVSSHAKFQGLSGMIALVIRINGWFRSTKSPLISRSHVWGCHPWHFSTTHQWCRSISGGRRPQRGTKWSPSPVESLGLRTFAPWAMLRPSLSPNLGPKKMYPISESMYPPPKGPQEMDDDRKKKTFAYWGPRKVLCHFWPMVPGVDSIHCAKEIVCHVEAHPTKCSAARIQTYFWIASCNRSRLNVVNPTITIQNTASWNWVNTMVYPNGIIYELTPSIPTIIPSHGGVTKVLPKTAETPRVVLFWSQPVQIPELTPVFAAAWVWHTVRFLVMG